MKTPANIPITPRDTTITADNAFSLIKLDSVAVSNYLDSAYLSDTARLLFSNFYNSRNFQYAWIDENGLTEHARMLWNLYNDYREYAINLPSIDSSFNDLIEQQMSDSLTHLTPAIAQTVELKLTRLFFDYAFSKYIGNLDPGELQWLIPRRKIDLSAVLDTLVAGVVRQEDNWEPLHPQYRKLKRQLIAYTLIAENGGWDSIEMGPLQKLQTGDADFRVSALKRRLQMTANFPLTDTSTFFSRTLKDSVMVVQKQFGLKPDGIVRQDFINELNIPVEERIQKILINMERARWLPRQPDGIWILANIPSFTLQVFNHDSSVMQMNIVVGKAATKTVIFSDELKYIVFSPYWNVPRSIVRNEILPAMQKNRSYLARNRMEITGRSNGLPVIRQLPGPANALGKVKFFVSE